MAIDTTECPVATTLASTYSGYKEDHTFKYELNVQITTGEIVWAPTPGLLGPDSDGDTLKFFGIEKKMMKGELYLGDGHYVGKEKSLIMYPEDMTDDVGHVRAIVEHAFARIKQNNCLHDHWRHGLQNHWMIWKICVHLTNIKFEDALHKHPHPLLQIK